GFCVLAGKNKKLVLLFHVLGNLWALIFTSFPVFDTIINERLHTFRFSLGIPFFSFSILIDPLAAFFLILIFFISFLCSLYAMSYMRSAHSDIGWFCFFSGLLTISMALVVASSNLVLFLFSWELMSLSSFILVNFENGEKAVRDASWVYIAASHFGYVFIIILFFLMMKISGSVEFSDILIGKDFAGVVVIFSLIGFGAKAGFVPLHVWLPRAHPAAPSHISALMSGVMIKLGIYGILRTFSLLENIPVWFAVAILAIGIISAMAGIINSLARQDIKKLLAYCSVENLGIIAIGVGLGFTALSLGEGRIAIFAFAGAVLHILNHCLSKSLLFFSAGAFIKSVGSRDIDKMGGIIKRMPLSGLSFLVGSASISSLPFFNGFIGEFLIYLAAVFGLYSSSMLLFIISVLVIVSLSLVGALALMCFTSVFGVVFLGEPRSESCRTALEAPGSMCFVQALLAIICVSISFSAFLFVDLLMPILSTFCRSSSSAMYNMKNSFNEIRVILSILSLSSLILFVFFMLILFLRRFGSRKMKEESVCTWDCGYAKPTARMQYTASSFVNPMARFFDAVLRPEVSRPETRGIFPNKTIFSFEIKDFFERYIYMPVISRMLRFSTALIRLDGAGGIHLYIFLMIIALVALLSWTFTYG
nr:proton-conducting transporter membrane subunit [Victivallales bacterium]